MDPPGQFNSSILVDRRELWQVFCDVIVGIFVAISRLYILSGIERKMMSRVDVPVFVPFF
jgi:hypothetical protein